MTTISDAQPGDIYVDAGGKTWRIVRVGHTIEAESVEGARQKIATPDHRCWTGWPRVFRRPA